MGSVDLQNPDGSMALRDVTGGPRDIDFTRGVDFDVHILNDQKAALLTPVVVYEVVLGLVGVAGNLAVVGVGLARVKSSVTSRLVVLLAGVDFLGLLLCVPGDVAESLLPLTFDLPVLCKLHRLARSTVTIWSGLLLVAIAADRYQRICRPLLRQLSVSQVRRVGLALGGGALLLSLPALAIFGVTSTHLSPLSPLSPSQQGQGGGNGTTVRVVHCGVEEGLRGTPWPPLYFGSLLLLFLATASSLAVLYVFIARRIWKGRKLRTDSRAYSTASLPDVVLYSTLTSRRGEPRDSHAMEAWTRSLPRRSRPMSLTPTASLRRQRSQVYSRRKTTFILFAMTATFIASCLPYLLISICSLAVPGFDPTASPTLEVFFHIGLRSFLISSAINPFIYGFCNRQFRRDCARMVRKRCCQKPEEEKNASHSTKASGQT